MKITTYWWFLQTFLQIPLFGSATVEELVLVGCDLFHCQVPSQWLYRKQKVPLSHSVKMIPSRWKYSERLRPDWLIINFMVDLTHFSFKIKILTNKYILNYIFFLAPFAYINFCYFSIVTASFAYNHPVYGARIQTHNHSVVSPLPLPLDHGQLSDILYFCQRDIFLWECLVNNCLTQSKI